VRKAGEIGLTVGVGVGLGLLIGYLLGFTHGAPTADNSSPPPEAFDYPFGILIGLGAAAIGRAFGWPLWLAHQRRRTIDR
jgi:hypothetical protein